MGEPRPPLPVKLFIGMLSSDPKLFSACTDILGNEYGPLDDESDFLPWDVTDYYREELGSNIIRKFLFFERAMDPGKLPAIKHFTNRLEKQFARTEGTTLRRRINIDPGYITEAKVVLATSKDFVHRLYIGENMYAEITLRYSAQSRSFIPHEFTYPDFRTDAYLALFNNARERLHVSLQKGPHR